MPSNIFANTGTNVSIVFIDKSNKEDIILIDASTLGIKIRDGKNQRTILNSDEINLIEDTFINQESVDDFSVCVTREKIIEKDYSFAAGQYFPVKLIYEKLTVEEFNQKIDEYTNNLENLFNEGQILEKSISNHLKRLNYDEM